MLFFSEDGLLMYSDGRNCIELFGRPIEVAGHDPRTGKSLADHNIRSDGKTSRFTSKSGNVYVNNHADEEDDDEFAAIEPAGVDKNGNSKATHNIRPDKSKNSGRIFGMNGKQFVHSDEED